MKKTTYIILTLVLILGISGLVKSSWAACDWNTGADCYTIITCPAGEASGAVCRQPNYFTADSVGWATYGAAPLPSGGMDAQGKDGDVTILKTGTYTFSHTVLLGTGHASKLYGQGMDSTIVNFNYTGSPSDEVSVFQFYPDAEAISNNSKFEIKGITIDAGLGGHFLTRGVGMEIGYSIPAKLPTTNNIVHDLRIKHMKWGIRVEGPIYGVAYNNIFTDVGIVIAVFGNDMPTWDMFGAFDWTKDATSQSNCASVRSGIDNVSCSFFFEDNLINWTDKAVDSTPGLYGFTYWGSGNRLTIRNNTYDFSQAYEGAGPPEGYPPIAQEFEMHDSRGDATGQASFAPMMGLIYGNLTKDDQPWYGRSSFQGFLQRGGKALAFDNLFSNIKRSPYPNAIAWNVRNQEAENLVANPSISIQHVNDSYYWGNRLDSSLIEPSMSGNACYGWFNGDSRTCWNTVNGRRIITTGTATGGGSDAKSLTDSSKNFTALGVQVGDWVVNDNCSTNHSDYSETCYAGITGCQITSISPNNTLNCSSAIGYQIVSGDTYYVAANGAGTTEDVQWWGQRAGTFDGKGTNGGGVGCGALASMPSSCTNGTAYWATNQGNCSDLTGWVGRAADRTNGQSTTIQGTLYKCSSSNATPGTFQAYWTPYTYPHPLRNEGTILYGDVDGSHNVTAYDAALVAQAAVGLITFTSEQIKTGDVDGHNSITAYDAALIAQKVVGLISSFPVEG